ncbi:hypothetical protein [Herbidospora daliensis]|uniref:hypothetical protein n=1 Tax=Herbidospora daliensis TaxID=295585 RepID=UPI0007825CFD|nr:hypothetical protein [Herbidospora daliensis]
MRPISKLPIITAACLAGLAFATPALAADGPVVVFQNELTPLTIFEDPSGCMRLPLGASVVNNQTQGNINVYADPFCLIPYVPASTIAPGYGARVMGIGSFSAS